MEVVLTKGRESKPTLTTESDYTIVKSVDCLNFEREDTPVYSEHRGRKRVVRPEQDFFCGSQNSSHGCFDWSNRIFELSHLSSSAQGEPKPIEDRFDASVRARRESRCLRNRC